MKRAMMSVALLAAGTGAAFAHGDAATYVVFSDGSFGKMSTGSGIYTHIATTVFNGDTLVFNEIAIDRDETIYGVATDGNLYTIDHDSGDVSLVGVTQPGITGLTINPTNHDLLGFDGDYLYSIHKGSGDFTVLNSNPLGLDPHGDLAFTGDNNLYVTSGVNLYNLALDGSSAGLVGDLGFSDVQGLGFKEGNIYGFDNATQSVLLLDRQNYSWIFRANFMGAPDAVLNGAAGRVVPEPASVLALGAGLALLARRKRHASKGGQGSALP